MDSNVARPIDVGSGEDDSPKPASTQNAVQLPARICDGFTDDLQQTGPTQGIVPEADSFRSFTGEAPVEQSVVNEESVTEGLGSLDYLQPFFTG